MRCPTKGFRAIEPVLVPCDDLGPPGDVDRPEDLREAPPAPPGGAAPGLRNRLPGRGHRLCGLVALRRGQDRRERGPARLRSRLSRLAEIERITRTATGDGLPVPDEVLTSALYAPPPTPARRTSSTSSSQSSTPEWDSSTRTVTASGEDVDPEAAPRPPSASCSRGATTASSSSPTAWRRATSASGRSPSRPRAARAPARSTDLPQAQAPAADERSRVPKLPPKTDSRRWRPTPHTRLSSQPACGGS